MVWDHMDFITILALLGVLGVGFVLSGWLGGEPFMIAVGVFLIFFFVFPVPGMYVVMGAAGAYMLYYMLIGFWL